ncbi:uncharacterized protein B0H18DRAFT_991698 [Fomitopsis serialis]|uniref:uncharacterized protein n=1 Tax=Fomitopsis serialis TaxID=139415 RepID=UPI002007794B|nr:uncharacterized protein B0H18DRAFT_991698 [Neoantrodia serialis]KAH9930882.1 hypothetical protein B0H18DRAFT_991698 [Neoantrodia serialis]
MTSSSSSSSSSSTEDRVDFAERISKARLDYSNLPEQLCPSSRPASPQVSSRAEDLKQAIMDAVTMANSNPTHPKWSHLTHMVRLHCTRRGYVGAGEGVRIGDVQKADIPSVEWRWGRKFNSRDRTSKYFQPGEEEDLEDPVRTPAKKADIIREKVKTWQANVVSVEDDQPPIQQDEPSMSTTAVNKGKLKDMASQGTLSQGSSVTTKKPGKDSRKAALAAADPPDARQSPRTCGLASAPVVELQPSAPISSESNAVITEVSEMSFLPPSFPSQLRTSTPPLDKAKAKPPPIMPSSPLSPPPPTQHITLPGISDQSSPVHRAQKRGRSNSPRHSDAMDISAELRQSPPNKKARTTAPDSSSSAPIPPPSTPPPPASSASNDAVSPVRNYGLGNAQGLPIETPTTPERQALPTLTDLLASSRRSKARPRPPRGRRSPPITPRRDHKLPAADALDADADAGTDREASPARTYFSSPASGSSSSSPRFRPRSPVSPLFSQNPGAFAPAFVSSQPGGFLGYGNSQMPLHGGAPVTRAGSGVFGLGYNSQFDVEGGVSRAAELLDRDVDYADWLRDIPEVEDEAAAVKQSQDGVAV